MEWKVLVESQTKWRTTTCTSEPKSQSNCVGKWKCNTVFKV